MLARRVALPSITGPRLILSLEDKNLKELSLAQILIFTMYSTPVLTFLIFFPGF